MKKYLKPKPQIITEIHDQTKRQTRIAIQKPMIAVLEELGLEAHDEAIKVIEELMEEEPQVKQIIIDITLPDCGLSIRYKDDQ